MIDVKDAYRIAKDVFAQLSERDYRDVLLEEVELSPDEKVWNITLGYNVPQPDSPPGSATPPEGPPGSLSRLFGNRPARLYKAFQIDAETGRFLSMKVRNPWAQPATH